ncbi:MAG TPA: diguanylate cyclase [Roseiarcus sp.]|nr:diguanylate cyclase [Roseiarcus sp.]
MELSSEEDRSFATRLMEHLVVPTFVIDASGRVMIWNKACERLTGVSADEIIGKSDHWRAFYGEPRPCLADLVLAGRYKDIKDLYASYNNVGFSDYGVSAENWCVMPTIGHRLYLAIDAGPIYDGSGRLTAVVETLRDITVQKQAQMELETLATRDGLTGLLNRRSFDERLATEARRAARERQPLSLLMLDIDCFKQYNDAYGHQKGDECLRLVAGALTKGLWRAGDAAARYGGEEFAVILPDTTRQGAASVAERMRREVIRLDIPHQASIVSDHVTVSIGGSTIVAATISPDALLTSADAALYQAKHDGRNRSVFPEFTEAA